MDNHAFQCHQHAFRRPSAFALIIIKGGRLGDKMYVDFLLISDNERILVRKKLPNDLKMILDQLC